MERKLCVKSSYLILEIKCIKGSKWNDKTNYTIKDERDKQEKERNLWLMRGPLSNQGWCLANAYSNTIIKIKAYNSLFKWWNKNIEFFSKNNCLTNKMINSLTLHKEVFIYSVYKDEQVNPLVVKFSLNLVNP